MVKTSEICIRGVSVSNLGQEIVLTEVSRGLPSIQCGKAGVMAWLYLSKSLAIHKTQSSYFSDHKFFVVDLTYGVELSSELCADSWCYTPHGSAWYSCVPQLPSDTKSSHFTSFKFYCSQSRQTTQILELPLEANFAEPLFYQTTRITLHRDIYTWQQAVQCAPSLGIHTYVCKVCS